MLDPKMKILLSPSEEDADIEEKMARYKKRVVIENKKEAAAFKSPRLTHRDR